MVDVSKELNSQEFTGRYRYKTGATPLTVRLSRRSDDKPSNAESRSLNERIPQNEKTLLVPLYRELGSSVGLDRGDRWPPFPSGFDLSTSLCRGRERVNPPVCGACLVGEPVPPSPGRA